MKNWKKGNRMLAALGLVMIAASNFIGYYTPLPDFLRGSIIGAGLGLVISALSRKKSSTSSSFPPSRNLSKQETNKTA